MGKKPILLANWIMCPDGTMLPSFHRHDFRSHTTIDVIAQEHPEGEEEPADTFSKAWLKWRKSLVTVTKEFRDSATDGGTNYLKRSGVYNEISIYSDDPFSVIRRFLCRGGRGKDSTEHITWTPLFIINDEWLVSLIDYVSEEHPHLKYYKKELAYRKKRNIIIK